MSDLPLRLSRVCLTLPSSAGPVEILKDADLEVQAGERVSVTGASGSGKSSLISVAAGLERPTSGQVLMFGEDLARLDEDGRARLRRGRVSLVFQSFHLLRGDTNAEEGFTLFASHSIWASKDDFIAWTKSDEFRTSHARAGNQSTGSLYLGHPQFEGFSVLQTQTNTKAA